MAKTSSINGKAKRSTENAGKEKTKQSDLTLAEKRDRQPANKKEAQSKTPHEKS